MVHIVEQAHTEEARRHYGVYVTMGPHLININTQLYTLGILTADDVGADYFPDAIIARIKIGLSEWLGMTVVKYQTHAAVLCPQAAASTKPGQE